MPKFDAPLFSKLLDLMESGSRVLNLCLNFHDLTRELPLPVHWEIHHHPACLANKNVAQQSCARYCGWKVRRELIEGDGVMVETCPFGHGQISVLLRHRGLPAGVLFAAPYWEGLEEPPLSAGDLTIRPKTQWISDRRELVLSIARRFEDLLEQFDISENFQKTESRKALIVNFLMIRLHKNPKLSEVADFIHLSTSRTGHLVAEIFQCTYPQLMTHLRLEEATRRLRREALPLGMLAQDLGFADQSHFTRAFKKAYGQSPFVWRKVHRISV